MKKFLGLFPLAEVTETERKGESENEQASFLCLESGKTSVVSARAL